MFVLKKMQGLDPLRLLRNTVIQCFKVSTTLGCSLSFFCCLILVFLGCDHSVQSTSDREGERSSSSEVDDASAVDVAPAEKLGGDKNSEFTSEALDREASIAEVEDLLSKGKLEGAATRLRALLVKDPNDVEVVFDWPP